MRSVWSLTFPTRVISQENQYLFGRLITQIVPFVLRVELRIGALIQMRYCNLVDWQDFLGSDGTHITYCERCVLDNRHHRSPHAVTDELVPIDLTCWQFTWPFGCRSQENYMPSAPLHWISATASWALLAPNCLTHQVSELNGGLGRSNSPIWTCVASGLDCVRSEEVTPTISSVGSRLNALLIHPERNCSD